VGFYDEVVRVYSTTTWSLIQELNTEYNRLDIEDDLFVFKEKYDCHVSEYSLIESGFLDLSAWSNNNNSLVSNTFNTAKIKQNNINNGKQYDKGFGYLQFSLNELYLVGVNKRCPNIIFIWKSENAFALYSVIVQNFNITDLEFMYKESNYKYLGNTENKGINIGTSISTGTLKTQKNNSQRNLINENENLFNLVIATENKNIYLIKPSEALVCPIPSSKKDNIYANSILWAKDGSSLICYNSNTFFFSKLLQPEEHIEEDVAEEYEEEEEDQENEENEEKEES